MINAVLNPANYQFSAYAIPPALAASGAMGLALIVLFRERVSRASLGLLVVSTSILIWLGAFSAMYCAQDQGVGLFWARAAYLGVPFIPTTIYTFTVQILGLAGRHRQLLRAAWLVSAFFSIAIVGTNTLIAEVRDYWWGFYPQYGWLSVPYLAFFFGLMIFTLVLYWRAYHQAETASTEKQRALAFLIAFGVAYLGSVDYLAKFGIPVYPFGYVPILGFVVLAARAIRRYKLVDLTPSFAAEQILLTMGDPLFVCDAEGTIRVVNRAACETFQYSRQELLGTSIWDLLPSPWTRKDLQRALERQPVHHEKAAIRSKSGELIEVNLSFSRLTGDGRGTVGVVFIAHDIQARRRAEKELIRLAGFPEENPNPIIEFEESGTVSYVNPAARVLFPDLKVAGIKHPILQDAVLLLRDGSLDRSRAVVSEIMVSETIYREEISFVPDQRLIRIYMSDITQHKDAEGALRRSQTELQQKARALEQSNAAMKKQDLVTHSLLEDMQEARDRIQRREQALEQANTHLKELGVLKDEFVAKVSHELRTPLTSIKEGLNLILDNALGDTTEEQRDFLQTMDKDLDRLTEMINNMLDIAKIEAGRMRLRREHLKIRDVLETTLRMYKHTFGQRTVTIEGTDVPLVFGDADRLVQIFNNLLSNAMKFTKDDGRITFRVTQQNGEVAVGVEDNGPGISPEDCRQLFQKFSQVGARDTTQPKGTGLGLVVCKELVELHRGHITVASIVNCGTTFTIRLPVYNETFALAESFRELVEATPTDNGVVHVGLVLVQPSETSGVASPVALRRLEEETRRNVHQGDIILVQSASIVVLAATEATGLKAIATRLRKALSAGEQLQYGLAAYPEHGQEADALLQHARATLQVAERFATGEQGS